MKEIINRQMTDSECTMSARNTHLHAVDISMKELRGELHCNIKQLFPLDRREEVTGVAIIVLQSVHSHTNENFSYLYIYEKQYLVQN